MNTFHVNHITVGGNTKTSVIRAHRFFIETGHLILQDTGLEEVAAFAPGQWSDVVALSPDYEEVAA